MYFVIISHQLPIVISGMELAGSIVILAAAFRKSPALQTGIPLTNTLACVDTAVLGITQGSPFGVVPGDGVNVCAFRIGGNPPNNTGGAAGIVGVITNGGAVHDPASDPPESFVPL